MPIEDKLDRIILILEKLETYLRPGSAEPVPIKNEKLKSVPLYKDKEAIERLVRQIFRENDERLDKIAAQAGKPKKKVPLNKDPVYMAEMLTRWRMENNKKIRRAREKGKQGLKLTKHEQSIYNQHLKKTNNNG